MASHMKEHANYYCIANKIIYDTGLQTLNDLSMTTTTRLLTSAAACFTCLLEEKGRVVSRKVLMHVGWERNGFIVTTNTFNQNILLIRKAIAKITEEPVLKTIFRQGITIPDEVSVISFQTKESLNSYINNYFKTVTGVIAPLTEKSDSNIVSLESDDHEVTAAKEISETLALNCEDDTQAILTTDNQSPFKNKLSGNLLTNIIVISVILIAALLFPTFEIFNNYKNSNAKNNLPLVHYKKTTSFDGLAVYLEDDKCPTDYALPFLEKYSDDFKNTQAKNLYVNCEKNINRISVFLCNKDVNDPTAECSFFYYL